MHITVTEIFKAADLQPYGPVPWNDKNNPVKEKRPGIYVIAIAPHPDGGCDLIDVSNLESDVATKWVPLQPVIYIGRTRRALSRRVKEFYRHVHGAKSPHRGGQDVILVKCPRWVYWSPTEEPVDAERKMIEYFEGKIGRLPFANRVRSARIRVTR